MANILVIDDNADLLRMMQLILQERGGHEVVLSSDGADGLSRALTLPPDLAIIDVMMPGVTGYDIVRRLREQPRTAELPILILTARGQMIDRQAALQAGASDHMAKPVTPKALLEKVDELLALRPRPAGGGDKGRVVSLVSLRGGVGVTTLAVSLALSACRVGGDDVKVCLVDLSPSSGHATLHLRVKARGTWAALPGLGASPSPDELAQLLTPHASGLQLLASPFEPVHASELSASLVEGMLAGLRQRFDLIVVDTPPLLDVAAAEALDDSDRILVVLTPEVGAIQSTVALLQMMDELLTQIDVVLNHICPEPGVPEAALEKALRRRLAFKIPYDPAQRAALPQGKPLAWAQPSSPLAVAAEQLLQVLRQRASR
jgi:pilus assembly protein CpaE